MPGELISIESFVAPGFSERRAADEATKQQLRASGDERYPSSGGLYKKPVRALESEAQEDIEKTFPDVRLTDPLVGVEQSIHEHIAAVTEDKEQPTIVLDFGGMLGLSFIRIAAQNKQLIEEDRLIMVVSNLSFSPDMSQEDEHGYRGIARLLSSDARYDFYKPEESDYTDEELAFVNDHQDLVTYTVADAYELMDQRVVTAGGAELSLSGSIDLIHEEKVLVHCNTPDGALFQLGRLLSDQGAMLIGTKEWMFERVRRQPSEIMDSRNAAYQHGMRNLSFVLKSEAPTLGEYYTVFYNGP